MLPQIHVSLSLPGRHSPSRLGQDKRSSHFPRNQNVSGLAPSSWVLRERRHLGALGWPKGGHRREFGCLLVGVDERACARATSAQPGQEKNGGEVSTQWAQERDRHESAAGTWSRLRRMLEPLGGCCAPARTSPPGPTEGRLSAGSRGGERTTERAHIPWGSPRTSGLLQC